MSAARSAATCSRCGYPRARTACARCLYVEPEDRAAAHVDFEDADGPGVFADNANCTWCSGEGNFWGSELPGYDPGWHDPDTLYPCPACHGTGDREDQVLF